MKNPETPTPIKWVRENQEILVDLIQELVRIPSVSGLEQDAQKFVFKKLEELNLDPKFIDPDIEILQKNKDFFKTTSYEKYGYENRSNVVGVLKGNGTGRSICLSGHIDVVSPEPISHWKHDPWGGEIEGDFIFGRGSGDMKAGVAAIIFAIQALISTNTTLKGDILVESTIEEELGGVGGNLFLRLTQPKPDAAIITEPAGLAIGIASAGVMYFRVSVKGIPAHAATAHFGVNAIVKMTPIIEALKKLHEKRQSEISYHYAELDPRNEGRATTLNIGTVHSGDWPSTVPALCVLECRIGFPPGETREEVRKQVEDVVMSIANQDDWLRENPPKIEWFGWNARPHEQDPDHPFVILLSSNIEKLTDVKPILFGGASGYDTRFFVHNGIPAVAFGPYAEGVHSIDERVSISSAVKITEILISTIMEWCG